MSDDVADSCTLPTAERPLRLAEFDGLLASALLGQTRLAATRLRWQLLPTVSAAARDLAAREAECCTFFRFTFIESAPGLALEIEVPASRADVLDGLAARGAAVLG